MTKYLLIALFTTCLCACGGGAKPHSATPTSNTSSGKGLIPYVDSHLASIKNRYGRFVEGLLEWQP